MELRQLNTDREREIFRECLVKARATHGLGFRETANSQLGRAHLLLGNLYALFEEPGDPAERMVAGFILHDLATFPQSYPKPDVSHLPARSVIEGGELWSLSHGAGRVARAIGAAVAGILQARAILLYAVYRPMDLTPTYRPLGFVDACEAVLWPYGETLDGGEMWIQPLILEGERLEQYIRSGFDFLFGSSEDGLVFHFDRPFAPSRSTGKAALPGLVSSETPASISATDEDEKRNGANSL